VTNSRGEYLSMIEKSYIEIEVFSGSNKKNESPSSKETFRLQLRIPKKVKQFTLCELISEVAKHARQTNKLILDPNTGRLQSSTLLLVNGRHMNLLKGLDTPLKAGDHVTVLPLLSGG